MTLTPDWGFVTPPQSPVEAIVKFKAAHEQEMVLFHTVGSYHTHVDRMAISLNVTLFVAPDICNPELLVVYHAVCLHVLPVVLAVWSRGSLKVSCWGGIGGCELGMELFCVMFSKHKELEQPFAAVCWSWRSREHLSTYVVFPLYVWDNFYCTCHLEFPVGSAL